jgi:hypothetical protein
VQLTVKISDLWTATVDNVSVILTAGKSGLRIKITPQAVTLTATGADDSVLGERVFSMEEVLKAVPAILGVQ